MNEDTKTEDGINESNNSHESNEYDSIHPMSDGMELELADGRRVRPVLETEDGERVYANRIWTDEEEAVYGRDADDYHVKLSFKEA